MTETLELEKDAKTNQDDEEPLRVCFVCTGNTCRSPMAAAALNYLGKGKYIAESAGIMADRGAPINPKALEALKKANIKPTERVDYEKHEARQLNMGIIESCDKIVAVGAGHAMAIIQSFPLCASKITSFEKSVSDPFGKDQAAYDACLEEIIERLKDAFVLPTEN